MEEQRDGEKDGAWVDEERVEGKNRGDKYSVEKTPQMMEGNS